MFFKVNSIISEKISDEIFTSKFIESTYKHLSEGLLFLASHFLVYQDSSTILAYDNFLS